MSGIAAEEEGDTIYAIDRVSEDTLVEFFSREVAPRAALVLVAEGSRAARRAAARHAEDDARWRIIVDPIDGTRAIMYQKRSAWILTGVAPNRGPDTRLRDIVLAVQTEIPLVKQHLSDVLWAFRGEGAHAERFNRLTGERTPLALRPSRRPDDRARLRDGRAVLSRRPRRARRDRRRDRVRARPAATRQGAPASRTSTSRRAASSTS